MVGLHGGAVPPSALLTAFRFSAVSSDLKTLVAKASDGLPLSAEEAEWAFGRFMTGEVSPVLMAALLVTLRARGVHASEIAGGVRALRKVMVDVPSPDPRDLVDTCGTGGGASTFNISTAAAFVAAGAGVSVAKHGNRSFTSRSGSADVLERLGVPVDVPPESASFILEEAGIVFMFAPAHHPAMRHVASVRAELGFPTVMNVLGPLTNPARAGRQVVGVADPELLELVAEALRELGHRRAIVVHGEPGLDELSPVGVTQVVEVVDGTLRRWRVAPEDVGLTSVSLDSIAGGEPEENAETILRVLEGEGHEGARNAVLLNAGAAVYVSGGVPDLREGVRAAERSLTEGQALRALDRLRTATTAHRSGSED